MENSACLNSTGKIFSLASTVGCNFVASGGWIRRRNEELDKNDLEVVTRLEDRGCVSMHIGLEILDQYAAAYKLTSINYLQCFGFSIDHVRVRL